MPGEAFLPWSGVEALHADGKEDQMQIAPRRLPDLATECHRSRKLVAGKGPVEDED